ncbi:MAG: hypothetical protein ACYDA6_05030 [Solirubrobacteraceae bacterium]
MNFKITHHVGATHAAPPDALDVLAERIGPRRGDVVFRRSGSELLATWRGDAPISMTQDERLETGRRAVLEILLRACQSTPELNADWFAVSPRR